MPYPTPKKIQLLPSEAKWLVNSSESVLLVIGLHELKNEYSVQNIFLKNIIELIKKAQALQIPIVEIYGDDALQGVQHLGELLSKYSQLMVVGKITPLIKKILPHLKSVTEKICLVDDAIQLSNQEKHIQWVDSMTIQAIHHMNTYHLKRLWALSAPSEHILSKYGILFAIGEYIDFDVMKINPMEKLINYGLDSVAIVSLVALWRANGANIQYENFNDITLQQLMIKLGV